MKTLLWGFPHKQVLTPIELIVEGVFELAKKNTGAGTKDKGTIKYEVKERK